MNVIWKRPDGFHGASPSDYYVFEVSETFRIWLHKEDKANYPFRISGAWQDEEATARLNGLVNLLSVAEATPWQEFLLADYFRSRQGSPQAYMQQLCAWIKELAMHLKGDSWEKTIMEEVFALLSARLEVLQGVLLEGLSQG